MEAPHKLEAAIGAMYNKKGGHITLLGDSIFDNAAYTSGQPDVITYLRQHLPRGWQTTLLATDGAMIADIERQIGQVAAGATHIVVSIGGNNALMNSDLLRTPVPSTTEALLLFGARAMQFEIAYSAAIDAILALGRNTTVCTIYNGDLNPEDAPLARVGLMLFNDTILRVAFERGLTVIDLRLVCTDAADYVNQIEPSAQGGQKIAAAIARALGLKEGEAPCSRVCTGG